MDLPNEITNGLVMGALLAGWSWLMKIFGFIAKNAEARLSNVEDKVAECATKQELATSFADLKTELRTHNQAVMDGFSRLEGRVDRLYEDKGR